MSSFASSVRSASAKTSCKSGAKHPCEAFLSSGFSSSCSVLMLCSA